MFPAGAASRAYLWQTAAVFADKRWYPQAAGLGERALAMPGGSLAADAYQLAQWELDSGRIEAARAALRRAVDEVAGTSYEPVANDAVFADLRAYYFLLPPDERPSFAAEYGRKLQTRGTGVIHAALATALLCGFTGDEAAACRELDRVVDLHLLDRGEGGESADMRRWNYLSACGAQLQSWHLDRLAAHVWRRGLAQATAFDQRDPDVRSLLGEIRLRALAAEVAAAADPQEARERVTEYLQERPPAISQATAASVLAGEDQRAAAVQIYGRLEREWPAETEYSRARLTAEEADGNPSAVDADLAAASPDNPAGQVDALVRRARLAQTLGQSERACRLLLRARRLAPDASTVLLPLLGTLERQGRLDDAEAIWRDAVKRGSDPNETDALASLEIRRGDPEAAFTLVHAAPAPSSEPLPGWWDGRRISLYLAAGHTREAVDLLWQQVRAGQTAGLIEGAPVLVRRGQGAAARELLATAVRTAHDPLARYLAQVTLVKEICTAREVPAEDFRREMRRLEQLAQASAGLPERFLDDRAALAAERSEEDWLEGELRREWDGGGGEIGAGDRLANFYILAKRWEPLRQLVAQFDARPNLPEPTLSSLAMRLVDAGRGEWALPILERLCRRSPQNVQYAAHRTGVLWQAGRRDEAVRALDGLDAQAVFHDDFAGRAAAVYQEYGDKARAAASLEQAAALDPLSRHSAPLFCRLATLYLEDRRPGDAYRLLTVVYRNPAQADMGPLVDYLAAVGRLEVDAAGELPGGELPLTFLRRAQLLAALCDRLAREQRGDDAFRLAAAHPELLPAVPALVVTLCKNATPAQVPALTALVEKAVGDADIPCEPLKSELANLYVRRSEQSSGDALDFLTRAYELAPDNFAVARPLAAVLRSQGQDARASTVLASFLGPGSLPSEAAVARLVLGVR